MIWRVSVSCTPEVKPIPLVGISWHSPAFILPPFLLPGIGLLLLKAKTEDLR